MSRSGPSTTGSGFPSGRDRTVPDRDAYFDGWSELHGGFDPRSAFWPRFWLGMTYRLGRPLAGLGVAPDVVTALAVAVTALALIPAAAGGVWPLASLVIVVASGLLDNLDGCVAVLTGRTSRWGYLLDSLADRVCDALYLLTLWLVGAPAGLCVGAGAAVVALEYGRARATGAGFDEIGLVTVGERPTRIVVTCFGLLFAAVVPRYADWAAGAGAAATLGVATLGAVQFLTVVRRSLLGSRGADQVGDGATGERDQR